jgi:hypothetical protein
MIRRQSSLLNEHFSCVSFPDTPLNEKIHSIYLIQIGFPHCYPRRIIKLRQAEYMVKVIAATTNIFIILTGVKAI